MNASSFTTRIVCACLLVLANSFVTRDACVGAESNDALLEAVGFYASFDEEVRGDFGAGNLLPQTRFDHPEQKGEFIFEKGYRSETFRINRDKGLRGGALEVLDVLPRRGRLSFPAKGNLAYESAGWGGAASFWLNTDPDTLLKTPFCDPIQITEKGANNGGLWVDFPDIKPRSFRLGAFRGVKEGEKGISEDDPAAPLVHVKSVGFKSGEWHHVLMNWDRFDTGKDDAVAELYIDGKRMGELKNRDIAMLWNLDHTRIYVAVNYIGLLDELAFFNRALTDEEIARLAKDPGLLTSLKNAKPGDHDESEEESARRIGVLSARVTAVRDRNPDSQEIAAVRGELQQLLATPAGERQLPSLLPLLLQLPAIGGRVLEPPEYPFSAEAARKYQQEYSHWSGLPLEVTNHTGMKLVLVPPGRFLMGSPDDEPGHAESAYDETQHAVWLTQPFYLSWHETTLEQFRRFVDEAQYVTDGEHNGGGHAHDDKAVWEHRPGTSWRKPGYAGKFEMQDVHPVVHVSHRDAEAFCRWLHGSREVSEATYGLPTESEWEWACRAGSIARFWWGNDADDSGEVMNVGDRALKAMHSAWPREIMPMDDGHAFPAPVGSYRPNGFGLHDMLGNVWEYCGTHYVAYPKNLDVDLDDIDPERGFAVRGGGWSNIPADSRCATRNADPPHFCHSNLGFRIALHLPPRNLSRVIDQGKLPNRVHVVETYETEIEKRWWLRGEPETEDLPPSLSASLSNLRAIRASETLNFDDGMGDRKNKVKGVVFNPVPGPPMGRQTRLSFRYKLTGTDTLKVQIYSLSNNYHRYLLLTGLSQGTWQSATVDMTEARRPDGSGGPLSEDERIDDIQFYIHPDAELLIDDIVLYDASEDEEHWFPRQIFFTGWFDTGKQGEEWPGDFEIVLHEKPLTWDAAKSVLDKQTGRPHIRVNMRGPRPLSDKSRLCFRYKLQGSKRLDVVLTGDANELELSATVDSPVNGKWIETSVDFAVPQRADDRPVTAEDIHFLIDADGELLVDDLLLYEP